MRLLGQLTPLQDLPVCLPSRSCVDESPYEARAINLMTHLTPLSAAIAIAFIVVLIASLVLIGLGLRTQWRGPNAPRWLVALASMVLLIGVVGTWGVQRRSEVISEIYSDIYGQPTSPAPASLIGSWPFVQFVSQASVILGLTAFAGCVTVSFVRTRHRPPGGLDGS